MVSFKEKLVDKNFFLKTKNKHSMMGVFFYVSHLIWWIVAVHPLTTSLRTLKMALGFSVFLLNLVTGYQAYYQYRKPSSRLFTESTTAVLGWQILLTIIVENFYFDYEFKGREFLLLILCFVMAFLILFDLLSFGKLLKIILFTPEAGGIVALSWNKINKIALVFANGTFIFFGIYYAVKIWFIDENFWLKYPDQSYVFPFSLHIFINYGLLSVLIMSLFQKRYLNKKQFDRISWSLGIASVLMYITMAHGKDFTILF